ncbi:outer membrane beta-barrel protein [Hanstruepera marina]|uniref:outer membrane beta-barrel protein n=1 Tax=Hanstruepera marina TaxID=2873265 RepID=UPI001CA605BF|nr:outer membrane beta-barrel protein [Hanstruepera marina]
MKKLLLVAVFTVFSLTSVKAQEGFSIGAFIGLPVADGGDFATFSIGVDATYQFSINEKFSVGPTVGFSHSFGDEYFGLDYDDTQFLPIAGAGRFYINEMFTVGLDLGYAVGINDGNDGGFYFRPMFGYNINERIQLNASYRGVSSSYDDTYYINGTVYRNSVNSNFGILSVGATFSIN